MDDDEKKEEEKKSDDEAHLVILTAEDIAEIIEKCKKEKEE